jgi:hypothetical protein
VSAAAIARELVVARVRDGRGVLAPQRLVSVALGFDLRNLPASPIAE